ncbi:protein PHYTOCHROME KINASE SUBSTRATE 4-like [Primulina tabacum]|uniref:protein PHYTOCHROME KINASE SUBSTRATE 4-like n=1 Tax=Primulina tabacum TaxID=48773 RepID=UPI003F5A4F31
MASATLLKNFNYNSSQQPMFNIIEAPLNFTSFAQNNSPFKDLSFSSYLKPKDKQNETNSPIDDTEISIFDAQKYFSETNDSKSYQKKTIQQKQKEVSEQDSVSIQRQSSVNSSADGYGKNFRSRSFKTTPTASSEASWNSQTGLLANPPGSVGVSLKNFEIDGSKKRNSSGKKWFLSPKSCCIGKKSVQVKETTSENENPGPVLIKEDAENISNIDSIIHKGPNPGKYLGSIQASRQHRVSASGRPFFDGVGPFSFPILNPSNQGNKPGLKDIVKKPNVSVLEDQPRKSLEVFQAMLELSSALRPDHNSMLNRGQFKIPGSPIARVTNMDDDVGSDASSDLFEIESLSTPTSYPMYRRRDSLEESAPPTFSARRFSSGHGITINNSSVQFDTRSLDEPPTPSVAATECYAPSEVSIDWSVTTAEGFDKASITNFSVSASEIGNVDFLRETMQQHQLEEGVCGDGGKRKGNGGLLLMGCRQEKAVSVGPQPVKCMAEGPPIFPLHVGGRPPRAHKTTGVAGGGSNAARLSLAFAA